MEMKINLNIELNGINAKLVDDEIVFSLKPAQYQAVQTLDDVSQIIEYMMQLAQVKLPDGGSVCLISNQRVDTPDHAISMMDREEPLIENKEKVATTQSKRKKTMNSTDAVITEGFFKGNTLSEIYKKDPAAIEHLAKAGDTQKMREIAAKFLEEVA